MVKLSISTNGRAVKDTYWSVKKLFFLRLAYLGKLLRYLGAGNSPGDLKTVLETANLGRGVPGGLKTTAFGLKRQMSKMCFGPYLVNRW